MRRISRPDGACNDEMWRTRGNLNSLEDIEEKNPATFSAVSYLRAFSGGPDGLFWGREVFRVSRGCESNLVQIKCLDVLIRGNPKNRKPGDFAKS